MARVANPLIGKSSGSIGGVTFSSWKGINVAKSKPMTVANPDTDPQKAQRSAFAFLVALYRLMTTVLSVGFKQLAVKKSQFNAFLSYNVKNAFDLTAPPAATFLPSAFLISKGTIEDTALTSVVLSKASNKIVINYPTSATAPGQKSTDVPVVAAFNETQSDWASGVTTSTRGAGTADIPMPSAWVATDTLHVYAGFVNAEGDKASDSVYHTAAIVA